MSSSLLPHHFRLYYTSSSFLAADRKNLHPDHLEINWGLAGVNRYRLADKIYEVTRGTLLAIPAGMEHRYGSNIAYEICSVLITREFLRKSLIETAHGIDLFGSPDRPLFLDLSKSLAQKNHIDSLFRRLRVEDRKTPTSWLRLHLRLTELFVALHEATKDPTSRHSKNDGIDMLLAYVQDHYFEPLDLRTLAQRYQIPYTSLSTRFIRKTGKKFTDYVKTLRLEHCAKLLRSGGLSATCAAFESGFEDLSNFHRVFKQHFGVTPLTYAQRGPSATG